MEGATSERLLCDNRDDSWGWIESNAGAGEGQLVVVELLRTLSRRGFVMKSHKATIHKRYCRTRGNNPDY